jgi:hypothetical protein
MKGVVGVFHDVDSGVAAVRRVLAARLTPEQISLLGPGASAAALERTRTTDAESAGMGSAVGAVVGGAAGGALGLGLGSAATAMIPGVGPVVLLGAALLAGGASSRPRAPRASTRGARRCGFPAETLAPAHR